MYAQFIHSCSKWSILIDMRLNYSDLNDIAIQPSQTLNITSINAALAKLASNDLKLANPNGFAPTIWECKWYNDDNVKGYDNGAAVWLNTENPYNFIEFYSNKIYNYAKNNPYLKNVIEPYSPSNYDLYYSILTGYAVPNTNITLQPLYDIGDMKLPAQIKISRFDNNKSPTSELSAWKDFIVRDGYKNVDNILTSNLSSMFEQHLKDYHFGNNTASSDLDMYLDKDLANMTSIQQYKSHIIKNDLSGFDYVVKFVKTPFYEKYYNSVLSSKYTTYSWKLSDYDKYADKYGQITPESKLTYMSQMSGCANYISDDIENTINSLTDHAIINITYTADKSTTLVPQRTTLFSEVSSRISLYDCTYDLAVLSTDMSVFIKQDLDKYTRIDTVESSFYPVVEYKYYKWFRLWKSGYLEHGGIVPTQHLGNISVNLDWLYVDNGVSAYAPTYDYPESIYSFYGSHNKFNTGNDTKYNATRNLKNTGRYVVQLTPINNILSSELSGNNNMYGKNDNQLCSYCTAEVNTLLNDSFSIFIDDLNTPYYSYYVSGFKASV